VYARSTTFHGLPGKVESSIRFIQTEAGPLVGATEGCRGMSYLVDHESGQCIATSSWTSQAAMLAGGAGLRELRERGRDILGGSMQVDEWEIAVMHRSHHGASCRVTWMQGDLNVITDTFRLAVLPSLAQTTGFCSASLLVNRDDGLACATTGWETRAAMAASRTTADELRARTATDADGIIVDVHEFDLAYAHLHVPEMA
jgi:quinol monooxygenase YgiN